MEIPEIKAQLRQLDRSRSDLWDAKSDIRRAKSDLDDLCLSMSFVLPILGALAAAAFVFTISSIIWVFNWEITELDKHMSAWRGITYLGFLAGLVPGVCNWFNVTTKRHRYASLIEKHGTDDDIQTKIDDITEQTRQLEGLLQTARLHDKKIISEADNAQQS